MLGGTFDRLEYRIRIPNDLSSLNMPAAMLRCCKNGEKATPIPTCVSRSDVCSDREESSFLLSTGKTTAGGTPCPLLDPLQKKTGPTRGE